MKFCEECGAFLVPRRDKKNHTQILVCRKCGYTVAADIGVDEYKLSVNLGNVRHEKIRVVKLKNHRKKTKNYENIKELDDIFLPDSSLIAY